MDKTNYMDEQLVAMIQSGDDDARKKALKQIYLSGHHAAKGRIISRRGHDHEAEDAVTDAIIVLDNHIRTGKYKQIEGVTLKSYFLSVCYWQWRSKKDTWARIIPMEDPIPPKEPSIENPETVMLKNDQKALVRKLLNDENLSDSCRESLKLWALSFSSKERAEMEGITPNYAKKKAHECLGKLREILERHPTLMKQLMDTL